jgi:hypothetical protein
VVDVGNNGDVADRLLAHCVGYPVCAPEND